MKIGIDARMYGPKQGGLGRYIQQLILHLEEISFKEQFFIFLRKDNWDEYKPSRSNFQKILADVPWYGWEEQIRLVRIFKKFSLDLLHFPHWNVPIFYHQPFVVTIHDLLLLHYPTHEASRLGIFSYWFKHQAYKITLLHAIKNSQHILTVSFFTKNDLYQSFKLSENKITVTYLAPFLKIPPSSFSAHSHTILKKYHITKPYVLYVGVAYPHKNLEGLLKAWRLFNEKYSQDYQLVLVGKKNFFYERLFGKPFAESLNNIIYTDFIPDEELSSFYNHASLYIMPSFYEGSALPSLEALAHHIPVASSSKTCLPEILQNAALYFNPENISEIARVMYEGLTNKDIRKKLVQAGQKMYSQYSWKEVAQKTLDIYHKNLKNKLNYKSG